MGPPADEPLIPDDRGLACPTGGFWIDPWKPVPVAVITHAHSDHARPGMGLYYTAEPGAGPLRRRMPKHAAIIPVPYGSPFTLGDATVSLHPAGHCLGSAQVRVQARGRVAVAAGDYKRAPDPTCAPFEVVPCDTFITEATFALPVYRWDPTPSVIADILDWWQLNRAQGRVSLLAAYALGKAQRLLAELALELDRRGEPRQRVFIHGAIEPMTQAYRQAGVDMLPTFPIDEANHAKGRKNPFRGRLVIAPPSAIAGPWARRFGPPADVSPAMASGWMRLRGVRRRGGYDRGFVISDHADWDDLLRTCQQTGASRVLCTHGQRHALARRLRELGIDADVLQTGFGDEPAE